MVINVTDISDYVKRAFGDESAVQITDSDILRWVNAGQRELASRNNVLRGVANAHVVSGQNEYDISSIPISKIHSIYVRDRQVEHRSFQHAEEYILSQDPERVAKGQPRIWWKWGNVIGFWPKPDFDTGPRFVTPDEPFDPEDPPEPGPNPPGGRDTYSLTGERGGINSTSGIKIYYIAIPKELTSINSILELPDEYYNRVVEYVLSQAYELDENQEISQLKLNQMSEGLSRMAGDHDRPQVETYPTITILEEDMW